MEPDLPGGPAGQGTAVSWKSAAATLCGLLLAAAAVLWLFERQISAAWFRLGIRPEIVESLERSLEDQKRLARLDPARSAVYRQRFGEAQVLLNNLRILEHNRLEILRRYELILLAIVGGVLVMAGGAHLVHQGRRERRIARLRDALVQLSSGHEDVVIGDRGRDTLGRIAAMIEETSRIMARDRRRLASLENLSRWQEAARRHAHEMRTPLTAARLEISRLQRLLADEEPPPASEEIAEARRALASVGEDLERLSRFARQFTSFARLPQPRLEIHDLAQVAGELVETFARAWPNLNLRLEPAPGRLDAAIDREMLRQVLVNLCDNSSLALGGRCGTVTLRPGETARDVFLEVSDDGPGVDPGIRPRIFEPYVTSRRPGEGMGLGLAISRKILLDHGGDLELAESSQAGTTFRLLLPKALTSSPSPGGRGENPGKQTWPRPAFLPKSPSSPAGRGDGGEGPPETAS